MSTRAFIIGIDPGTAMGWAVLDRDGARLASGVLDLSSRRHEGGGMRYVRARRRLAELLEACPVEALAYEEVARHRGTAAAHVYGGLVAVITGLCEEHKVPYQGMSVGTVKRIATGSGNASKEMMQAAARSRWPEVGDVGPDEADALWIAETWRVQG